MSRRSDRHAHPPRAGISPAPRCLAAVTALSCCLAFGGCAYFNTYYNGQRLYRQAQGRSGRPFPDTATATAGERAAYLKAVEKFAAVVRDHPDSRWAQNSLYYMGLSYYYTREYQKAERKFQEIWDYYPDSRFAPASRINAAVISWRLGDHDRAGTLLAPLREHGDRGIRERAAYLEALSLHARGNTAEAIIAWERYLLTFAKGTLARGARLDYARCLIESGQTETAIRELEIVAGQRAARASRHQVWLLLGQTYAAAGRDRDAVRSYGRILSQRPDNATAARTEYHLAAVEARSLAPRPASERYLAVANKYPSTQASAQCFFDMASLMEREQLPDSALALYRRAKSEFGTGPVAEAALRRASNIALLLSYRAESSQASREQGAVLQFLMAEQYLFGLSQPDSAAAVYLRSAAEFPDLPIAPKALLAAAWTMERHLRDTAAAALVYRRIIDGYPGTRYANGARDRLGLPLDQAVADSEPDIEFKSAAPAAAAPPFQAKPDEPSPPPDEPAGDGGDAGPPTIPGPDDREKKFDAR